ncbi:MULTISPECIES: hypothetical protein [Rhizobium]|uniref:hypothetical protein n=1 Tax=Rhizobium TaxID=379 RepID=UPI0019599460|nr:MULTISPECIES: hypothetical protein [Rhizobium]MBM7044519.1 hypothetical protein [Rhizobium lusitanum]
MNIIHFDVYENVKEIADVQTGGKGADAKPRRRPHPCRISPLAIAIASSLTFIPARVRVALVEGLRIAGQGVTESG